MSIRKEWLDFLRSQYPEGSRLKIREMKDPKSVFLPGTTGKLDHIDEDGRFHMKLDNGQTLALTYHAKALHAPDRQCPHLR